MPEFGELSRSVKGLTVLVTGAASGMGRATAQVFAAEGANVAVTDQDIVAASKVADAIKADGGVAKHWPLDVSHPEMITRVVGDIADHFGGLDIIVNNAGIWLEGPEIKSASNVSLDVFRKTFDTNFFDQIMITQKFLPLVKKSAAGRIVNLSSALGSNALHADPSSQIWDFKVPAYDASKAALNSYTIHLAYELKDTPIKVNAANPGYCATDLNGHSGFRTPRQGAEVSVVLATLPADGPTGQLWGSLWVGGDSESNGTLAW